MAIQASLEVELEDRPGQLMRMLAVFERVGANVVSVTHARGRKTNAHVPVRIIFTVPAKEALEEMAKLLREGGWHAISLEKVVQLRRATVGMIGHIIHAKSVEPLINRVDTLGANVSRFSVSMPSQSGESSALLTFEAEDEETMAKAMAEVERLCGERGLLLLKEVD